MTLKYAGAIYENLSYIYHLQPGMTAIITFAPFKTFFFLLATNPRLVAFKKHVPVRQGLWIEEVA